MTFRVGVTGTRAIASDAEASVRVEVSRILQLVSRELGRLAETPACKAIYAEMPGTGRLPLLRLVSPLAAGSDRLVAEEALKAGYMLHAPLPFAQAEYEQDFPESVDGFRALLAKADVLELDGTREFANESYREVGRFVVRNCDLLIAVWDGASERGPGGTAEIVRFATNVKVPVWWIDASGKSAPLFADDPRKLRFGGERGAGDTSRDELVRYLERAVTPPKVATVEHAGAFGRLARRLSLALRGEKTPLDDYLDETSLKTRGIWRAYAMAMKALIPKSAPARPMESPYFTPSNENQWWFGYFQPADQLSEAYGNRYRSSYVLIAGLAFIAVASPPIGSLLPHHFEIFVGAIEAVTLAAIAALVMTNYFYRWHERWISYRLLAELFRKQAMLWTIGRSLPAQEVLRSALTSEEHEDAQSSGLPRDAWIAWYFAAVTRSAPALTGSLDVKKDKAAASAKALIKEQIQYHRWRAGSTRAAASSIERAGEMFFFITAAAGLVKMVLLFMGRTGTPIEWLTTFGACLSALSGSFVGLRAYSELPLLQQQSSMMIKTLKNAEAELEAVEVQGPATSWELGHSMNALALSMMQDVTGWMQLFRIKSIEAA
ncbi:hypothetical protein [Bradyrhizobium sp. SYSU BS000235]|uniref:hypothetical protein n=1 Tax=Bradyrhizobium sp. SYSU BS000235 TaxID=3411332 RepID=UPI003C75722B